MIMRSKTCFKKSIIFSCFPCARRTRKELCHHQALLSRVIPTVSPLLTPIASRNLVLYQSLPTSARYRHANWWRRKDDTGVGTAARRIIERLYRGSCTSPLRIIVSPRKPSKMPPIQPVLEGARPWSHTFFITNSPCWHSYGSSFCCMSLGPSQGHSLHPCQRSPSANAPPRPHRLRPHARPHCALCEQETVRPNPPAPVPPDPLPPTNRRPRTMDTSKAFCPHTDCDYRGWLGLNNLRANGHPSGGPWRQFQCTACDGYFPEHHGTLFHRQAGRRGADRPRAGVPGRRLPTICQPQSVKFSPHLHNRLTATSGGIIAGAIMQHRDQDTQQPVSNVA